MTAGSYGNTETNCRQHILQPAPHRRVVKYFIGRHQRHAVTGEGDSGEHDAVFDRQQREHLRDGFAPVEHQEETGQEQRDGNGQCVVA